jgi:hypothetical protein
MPGLAAEGDEHEWQRNMAILPDARAEQPMVDQPIARQAPAAGAELS